MRLRSLLLISVLSFTAISEPALAKNTNPQGYYDIKNDANPADVNDPWESFNHPIFDFNVAFDRHIFKPFIHAYDYVPHGVRHSIDNFLNNLYEPLNVVHGILQLNPSVTFTSFWRFVLNTTFGLGGIDDFAKENAGLHPMEQNLGKTLGHWGVPSGPYVVLPILGPSSMRDTTGKVGDWFLDPVAWAENNYLLETGQAVADGISTRDTKDGIVQELYYDSLDPYTASRSAYRQHERFEENSKE